MTITERTRHDMLLALETSIGKEPAMTLAEHLPPVGWADVATKTDIDTLRHAIDLRFEAIDLRFEAIDARFAGIDQRFDHLEERIDLKVTTALADLRTELSDRLAAQTRVLYLSIISTVITLIGLGVLRP